MPHLNNQILIVGQGIAGTVLSFKMWLQGIPHIIIDNNHRFASTHAAAGIINPITGRRYVKSWMIDQLLIEAKSTYTEFSKSLNRSFFKETTIIRSLHNIKEENLWHSAIRQTGYEKYTDTHIGHFPFEHLVNPPMSYGCIKNALLVDVSALIEKYASWAIDQSILIKQEFDYQNIEFHKEGLVYEEGIYNHIVFADGNKATDNPYFKDLPFQLAKGESFIIKIDAEAPDCILRDNIFLVPLGDGFYWTGGGYAWNFDDHLPTTAWKEEWIQKLNTLLKVDYEILEHKAGIRPSVKGRRPLIGRSDIDPRLILFNGMGTKGTSLVPYWATHLINHINGNHEIDESVNIKRFV